VDSDTQQASARAALDALAGLYEHLKHPSERLVRFYDRYVTEGRQVVDKQRQNGYEGNTAEERAILASWEYYTWPAETGPALIELMASPLPSAATYQVTGEIVRAITGMYKATADGEPVVRASEMPSPIGFAYLDEPVTFIDFSHAAISVRAFSWEPQRFSPVGWRPAKGVRVTTWADSDLAASRGGDSSESSSVFVPYGKPITSGVADNPTRWLHCLWLFIDTEITVTDCQRAGRSSRRRAERAGLRQRDITVIMLPYRHYENGAGHREIDWSCRWVVQGHDRHLGNYRDAGQEAHHAKPPAPKRPCAVCGVRTTRVRSYVKGPGGLPLKLGGRVFRVAAPQEESGELSPSPVPGKEWSEN